jgi:hypothetical protein
VEVPQGIDPVNGESAGGDGRATMERCRASRWSREYLEGECRPVAARQGEKPAAGLNDLSTGRLRDRHVSPYAVKVDKNKLIIDLRLADLREADLSVTDLREANLRAADLNGADLSRVFISNADLSEANLKDVTGITTERLERQAKSLRGAIMLDGSKHP